MVFPRRWRNGNHARLVSLPAKPIGNFVCDLGDFIKRRPALPWFIMAIAHEHVVTNNAGAFHDTRRREDRGRRRRSNRTGLGGNSAGGGRGNELGIFRGPAWRARSRYYRRRRLLSKNCRRNRAGAKRCQQYSADNKFSQFHSLTLLLWLSHLVVRRAGFST